MEAHSSQGNHLGLMWTPLSKTLRMWKKARECLASLALYRGGFLVKAQRRKEVELCSTQYPKEGKLYEYRNTLGVPCASIACFAVKGYCNDTEMRCIETRQ